MTPTSKEGCDENDCTIKRPGDAALHKRRHHSVQKHCTGLVTRSDSDLDTQSGTSVTLRRYAIGPPAAPAPEEPESAPVAKGGQHRGHLSLLFCVCYEVLGEEESEEEEEEDDAEAEERALKRLVTILPKLAGIDISMFSWSSRLDLTVRTGWGPDHHWPMTRCSCGWHVTSLAAKRNAACAW